MANKDKKSGLTGGDILIAVLIALAGAIGVFLIVLIGGSLLFPESWERPTVEAPSAQPSYQGTLPSRAPETTPTPSPTEPPEEPSNEPEPEPTEEPAQQTVAPTAAPSQSPVPTQTPTPTRTPTSTPAPTRTPTAPTQNPAPVVSIQPVQNTTGPNASTQGNGNNGSSATYSRDNWPQGKFLGSVLSDKYHSGNCRAAATILPENEIWFDSEDAARAAGYGRCGICW